MPAWGCGRIPGERGCEIGQRRAFEDYLSAPRHVAEGLAPASNRAILATFRDRGRGNRFAYLVCWAGEFAAVLVASNMEFRRFGGREWLKEDIAGAEFPQIRQLNVGDPRTTRQEEARRPGRSVRLRLRASSAPWVFISRGNYGSRCVCPWA